MNVQERRRRVSAILDAATEASADLERFVTEQARSAVQATVVTPHPADRPQAPRTVPTKRAKENPWKDNPWAAALR